jgi:hypothetical protein
MATNKKIKLGYIDPRDPKCGLCVVHFTPSQSQIVMYKGPFESYSQEFKSGVLDFLGHVPKTNQLEFPYYMGSETRNKFARLFGYEFHYQMASGHRRIIP